MPSFSDVYASVKLDLDKAEEARLKRRLENIDTKAAGRKMGVGLSKSLGGGFRASIGGAAKTMFGPLIAAGAAIGGFQLFKGFIDDAQEAAKISRITASAISDTGGAAKISAQGVADLSQALSNQTAVDDELVQTGANLLLTFKNIRNEAGASNDIFNQATAAALDLSAAGFGSVEASAIKLGKALNDPVAGITALNKAGITFSATQKQQIKDFVEAGDILSAQKIILGEVASQMGTAAEAAAGPIDRLKVIAGNLGEEIGTVLLPYVEQFATWLATEGATKIQSWIAIFRDEWIPPIKDLVTNFRENLWPAIKEVWGFIVDVFEFAWPKIKWVYDRINEAADRWSERFNTLTESLSDRWQDIKNFFADGARAIVNMFFEAVEAVLDGAEAMFGWVPGVGGKLRAAQREFEKLRDGVNTALNGIKDYDSTVRIKFSSNAARLAYDLRHQTFATGGAVFGQGGPTSDSVLARLSPGEHVWTAKEVQAFGGHKAMELARRQMVRGYAVGGAVSLHASVPRVPANSFHDINKAIEDYTARAAKNVANRVSKMSLTAPGMGVAAPGGRAFPLPRGTYRWGRGPAGHGYDAQDLPVPTGTRVFAPVAGMARGIDLGNRSYGKYINIQNSRFGRVILAHLSRLLIRSGMVRAGQLVGLSGSTGNSTGPHLHVEPSRILRMDRGGWLPPGGFAYNGTNQAEPFGGATRVVIDVTGADEDMKRLIRKMVRVDGAGSAQAAFR